ncbi:MAG: SMC-Scp complex subunit ScpB [Acetanaerobacterium sp.]
MDLKELENKIEAVLFASGDPVEQDKLSEALEIRPNDLERLIHSLGDRLEGTALVVLRLGTAYQISTRPQYGAVVKAALDASRNTQLSPAAMEVLAVIAYNQPVTKSFVEQVRGVDSSGVITNLVGKSLVEEAGRLELPGRPIAYRTTPNFLRCFGLDSLDALPPVSDENALPEIDAQDEAEDELQIELAGVVE